MADPKVAGTALHQGSCDYDGTSTADFVKDSLADSGLSEADWFKKFNEGVKGYGKANGLDFLKDTNVTSAASLQSTLDSWYARPDKSNPGGKESYNAFMDPMFNSINNSYRAETRPAGAKSGGKHFFSDPDWQYKSSANFPDRWKEWVPVTESDLWDVKHDMGGKRPASWVDRGGVTYKKVWHKTADHFVDPKTTSFLARYNKDYPLGSMFKLTQLDANGNAVGEPYYAMLLDRSGNTDKINDESRTEVSQGALKGLNMKGNPHSVEGRIKADYLGPNTLPKMEDAPGGKEGLPAKLPNPEEMQAEGRKLDPNAKKPPVAPTAPQASASGGTYQIIEGEESVLLGGDKLYAAFANTQCVHTGGGYVIQGSQTVFVGKQMSPFGRVTDLTSDGYQVMTGEDTILIG